MISCRVCHEPALPERAIVHPFGWSMLCRGHWSLLLNNLGHQLRRDLLMALRVSHMFGIADDRTLAAAGEEPRELYSWSRHGPPGRTTFTLPVRADAPNGV